MVTYPRDIPSGLVIEQIEFEAQSVVGVARSIFTLESQVQEHQGQTIAATVTVAPAERADAAEIVAWGLSLRGRSKTFYLYDPMHEVPRGAASSAPGTPVVSGANQTGASVTIAGAASATSDWLKIGDVIQLGNGTSARLYRVLENVSTTASGSATLSVWPDIRTAYADQATVVVSSARGAFRFAENNWRWSERTVITGFEFMAEEAI